MATPAQIASPALRIRFIQAAKEGQLDVLKKYVADGVPVDITDSCGYSALHWAAAHGRAEVINFLLFNNADINLRAEDGMTPLHLAAKHHKLNTAHLLVEAHADLNIVNEAQQRPIDLCRNDPPMVALLRDASPIERDLPDDSEEEEEEIKHEHEEQEVVLGAAKDLVKSTLEKVSAGEEKLILACERVSENAEKVRKAVTDDYTEIRRALADYKAVRDEFEGVLKLVDGYRGQVGSNRKNVSEMCATLAQTQKEVIAKLQMKRTANVATRDKVTGLQESLENMKQEYGEVTTELEELEARVLKLRRRKEQIEHAISETEEVITELVESEKKESKDETRIAVHQEQLQATRAKIDQGDVRLDQLQTETAERLLKTAVDYADFLRKYMEFVKELIAQFTYKVDTMGERIEDERRNFREVEKLHLKLDKSKLQALEEEYKMNLDRFERRRERIRVVEEAVRQDFESVVALVGSFGRELEPLE